MPADAASDPSALRVFASITRLHVVAVASLGTLTIGWCFTGAHLWRLAAVCALDWLLAGVLNRACDVPEDVANGEDGASFVARHMVALRLGYFAAMFASLVAIHLATPALTVARIAFHALVILYGVPLLPGQTRIKQLYGLKNLATSTAFLLTCFAYPLAGAHDELAPGVGVGSVLVTAVSFFFLALSYELMSDLRDLPGDEAAGVGTLAGVRGNLGVASLVNRFCILSAATILFGFVVRLVSWRIAILAVGPLAEALVYRRWLARGSDAEDCVRIAWMGAGLLVAYNLWVTLGLPGAGG